MVNGPEDTVLSEMIKFWPLEKNCTLAKCFQERFMSHGSSKLMEDREIGVLPNPDAEAKEGFRSNRITALTSVMSKWYASCIMLRLEKEDRPRRNCRWEGSMG